MGAAKKLKQVEQGITTSKLNAAISASENRWAKRKACPHCEKQSALMHLVFNSRIVAVLCRFCEYVEYRG